jgi:hypothetical protein
MLYHSGVVLLREFVQVKENPFTLAQKATLLGSAPGQFLSFERLLLKQNEKKILSRIQNAKIFFSKIRFFTG